MTEDTKKPEPARKPDINGGRNLMILGIAAILIAVLTTSIELIIYRKSGDIYLDRSRPGFLPDEDEAEDDIDTNSQYVFSETGSLSAEELAEYLAQLKALEEQLDKIESPYAVEPLSDDALGLTSVNSYTVRE